MSFKSPSSIHFEQRLSQIYDHLYASASVKTPSAIAHEVSKILHTLDYLEKSDKALETRRLYNNRPLKSDPNTNRQVACRVKKAFAGMNSENKIYSDSEVIKLSDFDISYVYNKLSGVLISDTDNDIYSDAMEIFRSHWAKSHGGQFFTNQRVTSLAVALLEFNPIKGDDLVDICAGTGGFLLAAINHIRNLVKNEKYNNINIEAKTAELTSKSLLGQEIDGDVVNLANTTISSRIGRKGLKIVTRGDSILPETFNNQKSAAIRFDSHYCAATNPPFGTKITIKDPDILNKYELARTYPRKSLQIQFIDVGKITSRAPDILFIEQNIKLLKPGVGRLAIVVPFQIVSGPQAYFVREWLLRQVEMLAVIDLPSETFQPYTGTKTSLLVLKRRKKPLGKVDLSQDADVFMSTPKWIGHDRRGIPTYERLIDGRISNEILSDFPEVEKAYVAYKKGGSVTSIHKESFVIQADNFLAGPHLRIDAHYYRDHIKTNTTMNNRNFKKDDKWKVLRIKDVVKRIFYPGRFVRYYVEDQENSIPFLGGANISQLILNTEKRLSLNNSRLDELKVDTGWILVTRSGSTGIVSSVPSAWQGYAISEHVIRIIPYNEKLASEYVYAFLKSKYGQHMLEQGIYGSVIDEITPEFIGNIEMPVPTDKEDLNRVVRSIRNGEKHRQKTIEALNTGVSQIEEMLLS